MFAEERHAAILHEARTTGRVDVATLARHLDVTPETIRRDLTALERAGKLRRVHGGAIPIERFGFELSVSARSDAMIAEKERIAKAALAELPDAGSILLDAGTTTRAFATQLPTDRELLVVVNSPAIAMDLSGRANLQVLMLGGRLRQRTLAVVDDWAIRLLENVRVDVAFMATNGITRERGLTTPDPAEAHVKSAMVAAARRVVLLADHTKVGADYFARFANVDQIDVFVTDGGIDPDLAAELEDEGLRVVVS
jgi:DeoR family fructose operon transcriptional repressor